MLNGRKFPEIIIPYSFSPHIHIVFHACMHACMHDSCVGALTSCENGETDTMA